MKKANIAQAQVGIDGGADLTAKLMPRLLELSLTESREDAADKLDLVLDNTDGKFDPLRKGVTLVVALGWLQGSDVTPGLVDKGRFVVDEIERGGPPDQFVIRARSADLTGGYRKRRSKGHKDTTLGAVIGRIARANGYTARVHASLTSKPIAYAEQAGRSDMAFIRDLGKRYDAVATIKNKLLIFAPIPSGQTAAGTALPRLTLTKQSGFRWRFTTAQRDEYDGAEAEYHDRAGARRRTAKVGGNKNRKRLKRVYASEADARAAAQAEQARQARGIHTFDYDLALGDPTIVPGRPVTLQGWDSEIDGISWLVKQVTHAFGPGGLTTRLQLESVG